MVDEFNIDMSVHRNIFL